jgi:hypothetical protein
VCWRRDQGVKIVVGQPQSVEVNSAKMLEDSEVHLSGESEKRGGVW